MFITLSSENVMLTRGDIEMDFLFGKDRSDGEPCTCCCPE